MVSGGGAAGGPPLPIAAHLDAIVADLQRQRVAILSAPPGTGKTTLLPGALVDAGLPGEVVVLEPRRIAARQAARRVAWLRGGEVGGEVGYQVRHERRVSAATRIRFVTEGVLVRRLVDAPDLEGVGAVVLDEFHERHVEGDLALAMLAEIRATIRPDLWLVVMSATLDAGPLQQFLGPCASAAVAAPAHPVRTVHRGGTGFDLRPRQLAEAVGPAVVEAAEATSGDVLVFLPGVAEIRAAAAALDGWAKRAGADVLPLHGRLEPAAQDRAITPGPRRKVVLATNVAETSLTIDGVAAVVDTGLARLLRHDLGRGLDVLRVERISRASADQRRGRAGRTGPGLCIRLWSEALERSMPAFTTPEVQRVDVAGPVLQIRAFAGRDPREFHWLEPPDAAALARADALLRDLGALDDRGRVTGVGRRMLAMPLQPRLARLVVAGGELGCVAEAAELAALLSERELAGRRAAAADILAERELLHAAEAADFRAERLAALGVDPGAARAVVRAREQIRRGVGGRSAAGSADSPGLRRALLHGFPDRVARRRDATATEAVMVGGRGLALPAAAQASDAELLLALRVAETGGGARSQVTTFSTVERSWLDALGVVEQDDVRLDDRGRVVALRQVRYRDLLLDERRTGTPDPAAAAALLAAELRRDPGRLLGDQPALRAARARLAWLAGVLPDANLPQWSDADVVDAAAALCRGMRGLAELKGAPVLGVLEAGLSPQVRRLLQREAPTHLVLPGGRKAAIDYTAEQGPVVSARIQEVFGLAETPCIGGGRQPLCFELLAPNRRPVQVTRDLASFWANVYPRVRIELRRRYPKHAWPEDPMRP